MSNQKKHRGNRFKDFESLSESDRHFRITKSMMDSNAWQDLSLYARYLYGEIKLRYNGRNDQEIEYTYSEGEKLMARRTFIKSLDELISHGFIEVTYGGKPHRMKSKYGLSAKWQKYPDISVRQRVYKLNNEKDNAI